MAKLRVIIASTRPGRAGLPIAEWLIARARAHGGFDVAVTDLAELALPLLNEPMHPRLRDYVHDHTRDWSATVAASDAFVIVTPEYNHGYPAPLKNAIDYLFHEWHHKPVGFVSYGAVAAGTRAVQQLKQVLVAVRMTPINEAVAIPFHLTLIGEDRRFAANEALEKAAEAMFDELARIEAVLRVLRA